MDHECFFKFVLNFNRFWKSVPDYSDSWLSGVYRKDFMFLKTELLDHYNFIWELREFRESRSRDDRLWSAWLTALELTFSTVSGLYFFASSDEIQAGCQKTCTGWVKFFYFLEISFYSVFIFCSFIYLGKFLKCFIDFFHSTIFEKVKYFSFFKKNLSLFNTWSLSFVHM